ncbi:MBL fold metallo-hydrolase [Lewinella sp. 4G2]|uniref:MBL fold metallo-hydrolase n=1 Tax=Lewinella sp. 4G2 TaxID=1803372 RepID=UPI0018D3A76A|nr:MBL fold metallo-hydrolase [Lewinella sp. 4G2]
MRTSALLSEGDQHLAIDAGPDFRTQMLRASVQELAGLILTHEHNDHTAGLDDVRPFCFKQRIDMPVYCLPRVAKDIRSRFAYAFTDYPGVPRLDVREVNFGDFIPFGSGAVEILEVTHGKLPIIGLRWHDLVYLTDVKELTALTQVRCKGAKTVVISSLNRRGTHSHLSLAESLTYIKDIGADHNVLIHFSHRMGRVAEVNPELPTGVECGYDGMRLTVGKSAAGAQ